MMKLFSTILGALIIYSSFQLGTTFLLAILLLLEIGTLVNKIHLDEKWFIGGSIALIITNLFMNFTSSSVVPLIYLGIYLFVRKNISNWMSDSSMNNFSYILFAFSFPIFLTFITELYNISWSILSFALIYLLFLRFTDMALTKRIPILLFYISQVLSFIVVQNHLIALPVNIIVVLIGLTIWSIMKYNVVGGSISYVQRFFVKQVFRESR